jgi:hypothetical protein
MNSGTGNPRTHLKNHHGEKYQAACKENGWKYLDKKGPSVGEQRKNNLPPFSKEAFAEYLVQFVTADDQVRITS